MAVADDSSMGQDPDITIEAIRSRNVRISRKPGDAGVGITAVVIECVDRTCTVVGRNFTLACHSLQEAMSVVEELTPWAAWRETAPGFWVARTI